MTRVRIGAGACVALALIMVVGIAAARVIAQDATPDLTESTESLPGSLVLRLVERAESDTTIDLGESGDSIGDVFAFGNPVFDPSNQTHLGTNQGSCVRVVVGESWHCSWSLILPDGQIAVQGPFVDEGASLLAIVGGTGNYRAARGQVFMSPRDAEGTEFDLTYEIE